MGRRSLLTHETATQIIAILQRGLPICDACDAVGISEKTFQNWYNRGEKADRAAAPKGDDAAMYLPFFRSCKAARSRGKISLLDSLNTIALDRQHPKQAYALTWLLERMYPQQFGRRTIRIETDAPAAESIPAAGGGLPEAAVNVIIEGAPEAAQPVEEEREEADA